MTGVQLLLVVALMQREQDARNDYRQAESALRAGALAQAESVAMRAYRVARAGQDQATAALAAAIAAEVDSRIKGAQRGLARLDSLTGLLGPLPNAPRAAVLCTRASLLVQLGDTSALRNARTGLQAAQRGANRAQEARCHLSIARHFERIGSVESTGTHLTRALELQRAGGDRAAAAATLQWMGYVHLTVHAMGHARLRLQEAIEEGRAAGNASAVSWATMNLGDYFRTMNDMARAEQQYAAAEQLFQTQGDQRGLGALRGSRLLLALTAGDPVAASRLSTATPPAQQSARFYWYQTQASIARVGGKWRTALTYLDSASIAATAASMTGWRRGLYRSRVQAALRVGDLNRAELLLDEWNAIDEQPLVSYVRRLLRAELLARRNNVDSAEATLRLAASYFDEWWRAQSDHALRLLAFEASDELGARASFATTLGMLAREGRAHTVLELAEARQARELLFRLARTSALGTAAPRHLGAPLVTAVDEALRRLVRDDRTALIEFVAGTEGAPTAAVVATRAGVSAAPLPSIDSLRADLSAFRSLAADGADVRALGRRLGTTLLGPLLASLPATVERLIIVPDDELHQIPFDALVLDDGRFVLERFAVVILPSLTAAASLERAVAKPPSVFALGNPAFGGTRSPLPRSGPEARAVGRLTPRSRVVVGAEASEAFIKREPLVGYSIIHLATHAETDERSLTGSAIYLTPGKGEDGRVEPNELLNLRLDADLVFLSACRSAGGALLGGQGAWGLTAPLLASGARAVIATTWDIGDRDAEQFVAAFYRHLRNKPLIDALREAKLAALRAGAPASLWAAFTLTGTPFGGVRLT
jgi:hypothetical protein